MTTVLATLTITSSVNSSAHSSTEGRSIEGVFGFPDYLKVRSCMTLFAHSTDDTADFVAVLVTFYADFPDGREDPATLELLG